MRLLPRFLATAVCALALPGCGDGGPSVAAGPGTVVMDDYDFHPRTVTVDRGEALAVLNQGEIAHNLTIERGSTRLAGTSSFLRGDRDRLRVDLAPGPYRMVCTVPGHRELGMVGTLTVR